MRHRHAGKKLNRTPSHRRALLANMAAALIKHEQIRTTLPKAKALRPYIEKLVTKARKGGIHARREVRADLYEEAWAAKLCGVLAQRYAERPGGYTRIMKVGYRYGDDAPMAIIEFVDRDESAHGADSGPLQEVEEQENEGN